MKRLLLLSGLLLLPDVVSAQTVVFSARDSAVFEAILQHTFRPEAAARLHLPADSVAVAPVHLFAQTLAVYSPEGPHSMGSIGERTISRSKHELGRLLDAKVAEELVSALVTSNAVSIEIPDGALAGTVLVAEEDLPAPTELASRHSLNLAALSRPGYSEDGHAVVYATYVCGALCGYTGLFLLLEEEAGWRVQSFTLFGMS